MDFSPAANGSMSGVAGTSAPDVTFEVKLDSPLSEPITTPYYGKGFLDILKKNTAMPTLIKNVEVGEYADYASFGGEEINDATSKVVDAVAKEMSYKLVQSLGAHVGATLDGTTAASYLKASAAAKAVKTPPQIIHRQTRLFEDEKPPEFWAYQIEIKIKVFQNDTTGQPVEFWRQWEALQMYKRIHRSRVRALKVVNGLMSWKKIYADPNYFQWRVTPYYIGQTWQSRIQLKADNRHISHAHRKAAREQAIQNAIDMKYAEERKALRQPSVNHTVTGKPYVAVAGNGHTYKLVPSNFGSPADMEYVSTPDEVLQVLPNPTIDPAAWEDLQEFQKDAYESKYDVLTAVKEMSAKPLPGEKFIGVMHPLQYEELMNSGLFSE